MRSYWANARTPYVTTEAYYDRVEKSIERMVVPLISNSDSVLDIGCGNGRYTTLLAAKAKNIDAFDISEQLIQQAVALKLPNVRFRIGDATEGFDGRFDVVACMGVLGSSLLQMG